MAVFVERGLPSELQSETHVYILGLFERYVGRGLAWLRSQINAEYITSIDASLVSTLTALFKVRGWRPARLSKHHCS